MVLAVIDDLMLRSRVSTAAKALGTDVRFVSGTADALQHAAQSPTLIIVDLNLRREDPVALVGLLKGDAALARTRCLGFVSHVDTPTIAAARAAGIDEILARGAFVNHLADLLDAHTPPRDSAAP
jgi:PleD family two-component response regulator